MLGGHNEIHLERHILLCLYNSCVVLIGIVNADKALVLQHSRRRDQLVLVSLWRRLAFVPDDSFLGTIDCT